MGTLTPSPSGRTEKNWPDSQPLPTHPPPPPQKQQPHIMAHLQSKGVACTHPIPAEQSSDRAVAFFSKVTQQLAHLCFLSSNTRSTVPLTGQREEPRALDFVHAGLGEEPVTLLSPLHDLLPTMPSHLPRFPQPTIPTEVRRGQPATCTCLIPPPRTKAASAPARATNRKLHHIVHLLVPCKPCLSPCQPS